MLTADRSRLIVVVRPSLYHKHPTGVGANPGARGVSKAPGFDPQISATQAPDSTHLDSSHLGGVGTAPEFLPVAPW
jgi:hypothetical protein